MKPKRSTAVVLNRFVRHPAGIALDKWLDTPEGKNATEPTTLNAPAMQRQYLTNRLRRAFNAGWSACQKANAAGELRLPDSDARKE